MDIEIKRKAELWDYYQELVQSHGFNGVTELLAEVTSLQAIIDEANAQEPVGEVSVSIKTTDLCAHLNGHGYKNLKSGDKLYAAPIPAQQSKCHANADEACDEYIEKFGGSDSDAWHDAPVDGVFKDGFNLGLAAAQQSPAVAVPDEINWMHPKLQSLLSQKARYDYQLRLFDQILSDDWDGEFCYPDQEYTTSSHERLVKILADKSTRITEQDAREIALKFVKYWSSKLTDDDDDFIIGALNGWFKGEGRALLEKLNK